jgi:hypothetical protein
MIERMPFKEAKKKFIKRSFYCGVVAILVCWFMKLFGFDYFGLDLDNKFFNDLDGLLERNYLLEQIYFTLTLFINTYFIYCIVQRDCGKKPFIYCLITLPLSIVVRILVSYLHKIIGNYAMIVDFMYLVLLTSKFNLRKILRAILINIINIIYQGISMNMRSITLKNTIHGDISEFILCIDYYILLYLHKEVAFMDGGTWFFFGFTAWLYRVAGFIVGLFTLHPIKKSREWYEKGKAKEDARKAKKATK